MVPIISVVGKSDVGKTTFLEKLIPELIRRGYRVATVKHDTHGFDIDVPGKDTWKMAQAGSHIVAISSPQKLALIRKVDQEKTLDEIAQMVGADVDIILTEGYKRGKKPKIEVSRREKSTELLCEPNELVAIVTDNDFDVRVPHFGLDDVSGVADLLERRYLRHRSDDYAGLIVDGQKVPIKSFVQDVFDRTVRALVSTLHGADSTASEIILTLRKPTGEKGEQQEANRKEENREEKRREEE